MLSFDSIYLCLSNCCDEIVSVAATSITCFDDGPCNRGQILLLLLIQGWHHCHTSHKTRSHGSFDMSHLCIGNLGFPLCCEPQVARRKHCKREDSQKSVQYEIAVVCHCHPGHKRRPLIKTRCPWRRHYAIVSNMGSEAQHWSEAGFKNHSSIGLSSLDVHGFAEASEEGKPSV